MAGMPWITAVDYLNTARWIKEPNARSKTAKGQTA
jgi:hypothetical protein